MGVEFTYRMKYNGLGVKKGEKMTGFIMSGDIQVIEFNGRRVSPIIPDLAPLYFKNGGDL